MKHSIASVSNCFNSITLDAEWLRIFHSRNKLIQIVEPRSSFDRLLRFKPVELCCRVPERFQFASLNSALVRFNSLASSIIHPDFSGRQIVCSVLLRASVIRSSVCNTSLLWFRYCRLYYTSIRVLHRKRLLSYIRLQTLYTMLVRGTSLPRNDIQDWV